MGTTDRHFLTLKPEKYYVNPPDLPLLPSTQEYTPQQHLNRHLATFEPYQTIPNKAIQSPNLRPITHNSIRILHKIKGCERQNS